jgi:hypothetical protein
MLVKTAIAAEEGGDRVVRATSQSRRDIHLSEQSN